MTKVAIITRTKDRPTFLKRAVKSVNSQVYKDYVHIIVNDGGDAAVVEDVARDSESVQLFHRDKPSNAPDTIFNESIQRIDSEYVVVHDDDDTWHPEFLERTIEHLEKTGAKGVVASCDKITEAMREDGRIEHLKTEPWMHHVTEINLYRQCIDNQTTPIAFVYRRDTYDELKGYDDSLPVLGDWDFGLRFLQKYDVDFINPGFPLAHYHHRQYAPNQEGNTSYSGNQKAKHYTNLLMNKYLRQELSEGRLGVGYIMSKLRYDESRLAQMARKLLPGFVTNRIKKRVGN